ncbi:MAG: hypothetical protein C0498_11040 [Anaerolinea sp.]|nr:hypothetical protein [Anaerolinea sp.]
MISSPPYATRIDYVVATRPELAVLSVQSGQPMSSLRNAMLGTPTMTSPAQDAKIPWLLMSDTASRFLGQVAAHRSKASAGYYSRYFEQYFRGLASAVSEMTRVCTEDAPIALVVQDSYYKEVRLDLAAVLREMLTATGRSTFQEKSFSTGTRAATNPKVREYRSTFKARETLLLAVP